MEWARSYGASLLLDTGPIVAFAAGIDSPALYAWSSEHVSGVFLGEVYGASCVGQGTGRQRVVEGRDAATLVAFAYATHGGLGLSRLEGLFCTVLWDEREGQLVLYRDGSCARALYWHQGPTWAAAGTRLEVLAAMPGVSNRVTGTGLQEYLRFLDISPPHTIYADIQAVEPGVPGFARGGRLEYLEKPLPSPRQRKSGPRPTTSFTAAIDTLDEALHASVASRLNGNGPTGVFLSGGIDSAVLCAIAADIDRDAVETFTLGFDADGYDETPIARRIAEALRVRHHSFRYEMDEYAEAFDDFVASVDVPFADPAGLPTLLLYRDCRKHVSTVLDGTGADTLLGVMPARHVRVATQYATVLAPPLRRGLRALLRRLTPLAGYASIFDFDTPEELLIRWRGWSKSDIEALFAGPSSLERTRFFHIYKAFPKSAHLARYSALLGNLPDDRVHQAAELTSLRVRFPYWDRQVEALIESLPLGYRFTPSQPKRILRALLARYVPSAVWDVPKHGFDFPFVQLLRHADGQLIKRHLRREVIEPSAILPYELVFPYVERFLRGDDALAFRIWALLILFGWLTHHE